MSSSIPNVPDGVMPVAWEGSLHKVLISLVLKDELGITMARRAIELPVPNDPADDGAYTPSAGQLVARTLRDILRMRREMESNGQEV